MSGNKATGERIGIALVLAALALHATAWISRSSFRVDGVRWFCLLDDAMISMRYARHLAQGLRLRFNPGEAPVESFTNLLWVCFLAWPRPVAWPPSAWLYPSGSPLTKLRRTSLRTTRSRSRAR